MASPTAATTDCRVGEALLRSHGQQARGKRGLRGCCDVKVFVINLDRAPERLAHMQAEFGRLGVPFERLPAVDGAALPATEIARWTATPMANGACLTPGEIGCILSHRKCWQAAAAANEPVAVFEDDVFLSDDAAAFLGADDWLPADADIVKLETFLRPTLVDKAAVVAGARALTRLRSMHIGAGGYVVTLRGLEILCSAESDALLPLDHLLFDPVSPVFERLVIYQMEPAVCVQQHVAQSRRGRRADVASRSSASFFGSALKNERTDRRPHKSPAERIWREIQRPFVRLGDAFTHALATATTPRRWITVAFR